MKKFSQYKLTQNDKQIIKNFKIDCKYKTLFTGELELYWKRILNLTECEKNDKNDKILKRFLYPLLDTQSYIVTIDNIEYMFFDYNEKNFYNIALYNITNNKFIDIVSLNISKNSIEIFKVICSILIEERKQKRTLSYRIKLPNKNTKFWFKLIDKVNRELWKYSQLNIKKIKNEYYYFYRGSRRNWHSLRFLMTTVRRYKKPFINIQNYILKYTKKPSS